MQSIRVYPIGCQNVRVMVNLIGLFVGIEWGMPPTILAISCKALKNVERAE